MVTATERKQVVALHRKRERAAAGLFLVEGVKLVDELLAAGWAVEGLYATADWRRARAVAPPVPVRDVTEAELARLSALETPHAVLAVARIPPPRRIARGTGLALLLDDVRDPGNVGTILRAADWFGVAGVVLSPESADRFNPKVVQASMGAVFRVPVEVCAPEAFLRETPPGTLRAGACLDGDNVYTAALTQPAALVLGNESRGIAPALAPLLDRRLAIPRTGRGESLNVAMATALFCAEWQRERLRAASPNGHPCTPTP